MAEDWQPQFVPPPAPPAVAVRPSRLTSLPTLAVLMIVHGVLVLSWAGFCLFAISIGAISIGTRGAHGEDWFVIVAYSVFGISAFVVGASNVVSGVGIRKLRGHKLAFGTLIASTLSFFCGNVFCLPFAICLLVYGIIVLTDPEVRAAFTRVEAGEPAEVVLAGRR